MYTSSNQKLTSYNESGKGKGGGGGGGGERKRGTGEKGRSSLWQGFNVGFYGLLLEYNKEGLARV